MAGEKLWGAVSEGLVNADEKELEETGGLAKIARESMRGRSVV